MFNHCMRQKHVAYSEITPYTLCKTHRQGARLRPAYLWLEARLGFFPLFLSAGETDRDLAITGYPNVFHDNELRALFSFSDIPKPKFMDYSLWEHAMWQIVDEQAISDNLYDHLFRKERTRDEWLEIARASPGTVQVVTSILDLRKATRVLVQTEGSVDEMERLGFRNVEGRMVYYPVEVIEGFEQTV